MSGAQEALTIIDRLRGSAIAAILHKELDELTAAKAADFLRK